MITLNAEEALKGLGNNTSLYRRVLTKFIDGYESAATTLGSHIANQEMEQATRLAHTIKGLAGSIGAPELAEKALILEQAIQFGADAEGCAPSLAQFAAVLAPTIAACRETCAGL